MTAAPFVVLMVAATISVAAQQPSKQPGPPQGKVVEVQIVVGTEKDNLTTCAAGKNVAPTTVFVTGADVHHCVGGKLLSHAEEKKQPDLFKQTLVQLQAGDRIQWSSNVPFTIARIERHAPVQNGAPAFPFLEMFDTKPATRVTSGGVLDLEYPLVQQYKVSFQINGILVDPDFVCSM
jgi:hypothetical protein